MMRRLFRLAMVIGWLGLGGHAGNAGATLSIDLSGPTSLPLGGTGSYDIILTTDTDLFAATVMIGLSNNRALITAASNTPPAPLGPVPFQVTPPIPNGTQVGAYGGLGPVAPFTLAPGTYTLGTMTLVGSAQGSVDITPFQRAGIDDWIDGQLNVVIPTLNTT